MKCDADGDFLLTKDDLTTCIDDKDSGIHLLTSLKTHEQEVITYMDRKTDLTFYDYIFLRKVQLAL